MNVKLAREMLEDWDDVCKELGIPHFLIYGTCLGFYRDGDFIEWDSDVDTRVICDLEKWDELVASLKKRGIVQGKGAHYREWGFSKKGLLFCIERSEEVGFVLHRRKEGIKKVKVMPLYHEFDTIEYKGREYNVPHPVEEYLEGRYGKDWRIPDPDWDKYTDPLGA